MADEKEQLEQQQEQTPPSQPGSYDGELSPGGQWRWQGTGASDDRWVAVGPIPEGETRQHEFGQQQLEEPSVQAAPTPGTAIASSATIDSLFTLAYGTRTSELSATPTYSWGTGTCIVANWPAVVTNGVINNSAMFCRFEARSMAPSSITQ